jgi:phosphodiesterase/alkaline phosphatase D-like protein
LTACFSAFDEATLTIRGTKTNNLGISDLRIWNKAKAADEFEKVRDWQPVETKTNHPVGYFYTVNRQDRYALQVLPSGFITYAPMPAMARAPRLGRVRRYDSLGRYAGESRFKETGLGGGQQLPTTAKLGHQFYDLTAEGHAVVSTQHGVLPGDNAVWNREDKPGSYLCVRYHEAALVPRGTTWKYLDNGSNQGTAWRAPGFNDGSWASGPAPLGYGDPVATTLSFGGNPSNKYVTTYFRKTFVINDPENYGDLYIGLRRDDGAIVYLNGTEVIRSNLRDVAINYLSLAYASQAGTEETNFYNTPVSNRYLQDGTNTLAVELHQVDVTSSDIEFDLCFCGTRSFDEAVATGSSTPWPNALPAFNPNRDRAWIEGDDGHIYEVSLVSQGASAVLQSEFIARERTVAEIALGEAGTYSEQPTGAAVILTGNSKALSVDSDGTVYLKSAGTRTSPPLFMYLNARTVEDVADAHARWTENGDDHAFGNQQITPVAALNDNGVLEFTNNSAITPGNYRLTIESGNIGKVDSDFDGFAVEITVDATVLQKRLLQGLSGYNFRGTDVFEFEIGSSVDGEWLMSIQWTNAFTDVSRGTKRQLAVYSYKLERIATELYKVETAPSGSVPQITQLTTSSSNGGTSGGWLVGLTSYGTIGQWQHESTVYPANDTVTSKLPLSDILTATTVERREDIVGPTGVILVDTAALTMPSIGTIAEATGLVPQWLWSGAVTANSAVISARMPADSALVQAVVSTTGSLTNPIYSDYAIANADNGRVAKLNVTGLQPNQQYYYAIATAGTIASSVIGKLKTWDESTLNFTFALGSCVDNRLTITTDPAVFDTIRAQNPLFFLHMGDLHYNDGAQETISEDGWQNCVDDLMSKSPRQRQFYRELPVIYMWDDHDSGPSDGGKAFTRTVDVQRGFRRVVPHYPTVLGADVGPVAFTFAVGRCLFIVTDLRSENSAPTDVDNADKSHLGERQKAWFKQQLLYAKDNYPVIFWVNTIPWVGAFFRAVDNWAGYITERQEIADFITANGIQGVFILSGDMHAVAVDDGTNSVGRFPCFQAAPLYRDTSVKGGPYTTGPFPPTGSGYRSQYGLITVADDGTNAPQITFVGKDDTAGTNATLCTNVFLSTDSPKP